MADTVSQLIYNIEVKAKELELTERLDDLAGDAEDLTILALNYYHDHLAEALDPDNEDCEPISYPCSACTDQFWTARARMDHIENVHNKNKEAP